MIISFWEKQTLCFKYIMRLAYFYFRPFHFKYNVYDSVDLMSTTSGCLVPLKQSRAGYFKQSMNYSGYSICFRN